MPLLRSIGRWTMTALVINWLWVKRRHVASALPEKAVR
jgi:hypothetical protein